MGIDIYKGMKLDEDSVLDDVLEEEMLRLRIKGMKTMVNWFEIIDSVKRHLSWSTPHLGTINTHIIIKYLNRKLDTGWHENDRDILNDIRELYLINKNNSIMDLILTLNKK